MDAGNLDESALLRELLLHACPPEHAPAYPPVLVDVGAFYGGGLRPYLDAGWDVVAFEPDRAKHRRLAKLELEYAQLDLHTCAIGETACERAVFYTSEESQGIASLSAFRASHRESVRVRIRRLDEIIAGDVVERTALLKVDAEGHDLFVLRSWDWGSAAPAVVLAEFEDAKTVPLGYSMRDLGSFLLDHGYRVFVSEWAPVERYGVRHSWRRITPYIGANTVIDSNAWGNFIAVIPGELDCAIRHLLAPLLS